MKKASTKNKAKSATNTEVKIGHKPSGVDKITKDSNATCEGGKSRITFLTMQNFRGRHYKEGDTIVLPENDAQAYSKRSNLKIEPIV